MTTKTELLQRIRGLEHRVDQLEQALAAAVEEAEKAEGEPVCACGEHQFTPADFTEPQPVSFLDLDGWTHRLPPRVCTNPGHQPRGNPYETPYGSRLAPERTDVRESQKGQHVEPGVPPPPVVEKASPETPPSTEEKARQGWTAAGGTWITDQTDGGTQPKQCLIGQATGFPHVYDPLPDGRCALCTPIWNPTAIAGIHKTADRDDPASPTYRHGPYGQER